MTAESVGTSEQIRIGIAGYGNLSRGVGTAIGKNPDMTLVGVFTRRDPAQVTPVHAPTSVFGMDDLSTKRDDIDVLILCGGSKEDLPVQGPELAVHVISAEELARDHQAMPHGGFVIRSGNTSDEAAQVIEYRLALDSNPEFTASVLVTYARAAFRLNALGQHGAVTLLDVPPAMLSPKSGADLRAELF